ncbi:hypothetical protein BKA61DRAFT_667606 [Leptodontidium sp. MPI-SDFR-AT-0119]|nr:hypothetical protein BKA61DRAFT_667606 [Leptodontidium sp. MPI-SDFR-AT-0119]
MEEVLATLITIASSYPRLTKLLPSKTRQVSVSPITVKKRVSIHQLLPTALAALPCLTALATTSYNPAPMTNIHIKRQSSGLLFDILNLPIAGISIREINISLITFQDEVFDISNILIFGTVNDGSVNCTSPEPEAGDGGTSGTCEG